MPKFRTLASYIYHRAGQDLPSGGWPHDDLLQGNDIWGEVDLSQLARALMQPEYHSESPPVPYATWRDGTSTARDRTTLELNPDVDNLVRKAQTEFEDRYGTNIPKADLREFAMVCGLAHFDDVFEMAEEWGIQYDN